MCCFAGMPSHGSFHLMRALVTIVLLLTSCMLRAQAPQNNLLSGTSWQLVAIYSANDSAFEPRNPEDYVLRFRSEGRLQIEADCNQAGAGWTVTNGEIELSGLVTTRKLCISPSLFNRYIMALEQANSLQLSDERLIITTHSGIDRLEFQPLAATASGF